MNFFFKFSFQGSSIDGQHILFKLKGPQFESRQGQKYYLLVVFVELELRTFVFKRETFSSLWRGSVGAAQWNIVYPPIINHVN